MPASVYEFEDYKEYLLARFPTQGAGRGSRARLAERLRCQPAFVSQVLGTATHLSLEHAAVVDEFLEHSDAESHYFLLLVHRGRAGSQNLRKYYDSQLELLRRERQKVA